MKVISRNSKLALLQVGECFSLFPQLEYELVTVASFGDKRKDISLLENPPADIFTRELDDAILSGKADVAVHSAKDLPYPLPEGLEVISLLKEFDQTDSLVSKNNRTLAELSTGSKIGTSSPTRKRELLAMRSDLQIVSIRGTIEERISQVESGFIDALIVATCALKRLNLENLIAEVLPFETQPLQGLLAVVAASDRTDLKEMFSVNDVRKTYGKVILVGFGPGSPDLLTIGGEKAISQADTIFYDDLLDKDFLQKYNAKLIYVGKRKGQHSAEQAEINRMLLDEAKSGKNVIRLKGGDPMIFAHGGEEVEYLKSNFVEVSVIPGITTALALASITQIPLTHRGIASSVAFVSGQAAEIKLPDADTVVCYMAGYNIPQIAAKAIAEGRNPETPVLLVSKVSTSDQQEFFHTLESLSRETNPFPTPIISIIGDVVRFRHKSERTIKQPLYLYTGSEITNSKLNGKIINQPLIELAELEDKTEIKFEINRMENYDWILFTSRYAVKYFFEVLNQQAKDSRILGGIKIASIGITTTKALHNKGLIPDLQPADDSSFGVIESIKNLTGNPGKILIPRSELALPIIPQGLTDLGWEVKSLISYRNRMPGNLKQLDLTPYTGIIFASPSCVDNFVKLYGELPENKELIARGKVTQERINHYSNIPISNKKLKDEKIQTI
ncbi:MAG: uroporphyrinogen-III C-methyltransferase [Paludibacter sp.]|nr:uroporphyrinogen-III C-methyltransferase [Paludibacter sp.]